MSKAPPRILSIAGSDSSGGAGIQADIKTITMLGGYAMTAITAVTAQNTLGVQGVEVLPTEFVTKQIESCLDDIGVDALKIGMVGSAQLAEAIEHALADASDHIVFDPVMIATSGAVLADDATIQAFNRLMAICEVVTPNLPELAALTGLPCTTEEQIANAAELLMERHGCAVLVKGGHADGDQLTDFLFRPNARYAAFTGPRIDTPHTHGTGCTLSAALATLLGHGQPLEHAVRLARQFTRAAIESAPGFGGGHGPLGHQAVRSLN